MFQWRSASPRVYRRYVSFHRPGKQCLQPPLTSRRPVTHRQRLVKSYSEYRERCGKVQQTGYSHENTAKYHQQIRLPLYRAARQADEFPVLGSSPQWLRLPEAMQRLPLAIHADRTTSWHRHWAHSPLHQRIAAWGRRRLPACRQGETRLDQCRCQWLLHWLLLLGFLL